MVPQKRTNNLENAKEWLLKLRTEGTIDPQEAAKLAAIFCYPQTEDLTLEEQIEELKYELKVALIQRGYLKLNCGRFVGILAFLASLGFIIGGFYPSVCAFLFVLFPFGVAFFWQGIKVGVEKVIPPYRSISKEEIPKDEQKE